MGFDEEYEDSEAEIDDRESPDASDMDDPGDESAQTIPCPWCGAEIYEQAETCPRCGKYISREDTPLHVPLWILVGVILCLIVIAIVWVR